MKFINKPITRKLKSTNNYYKGVITEAKEYTTKGKEYISLNIEMDDCFFQTSVFSEINSDNALYDIAKIMVEESEGKELKLDDFLGCQIQFLVSDRNDRYSKLDIVEFDDEA